MLTTGSNPSVPIFISRESGFVVLFRQIQLTIINFCLIMLKPLDSFIHTQKLEKCGSSIPLENTLTENAIQGTFILRAQSAEKKILISFFEKFQPEKQITLQTIFFKKIYRTIRYRTHTGLFLDLFSINIPDYQIPDYTGLFLKNSNGVFC